VTRTRRLNIAFFATFLTLSACTLQQSENRTQIIKPNSNYADASEGLYYLSQGYTDKAQKKLQLAIARAPNDPLILNAIAYYYEKTGSLNDANRYYLKAIKVAPPKYGTALANYGAFLCRNGHYKESLNYFCKAAQTNYPYGNKALANARFCRQEMQRKLGSKAT
jgi:type IV pilus assembly protein PilF